jgi:hypothetical protein
MTAPMQISLPLALQLRTPIRQGPVTDGRRRLKRGSRDPKNYQDGFDVQDIFAIEAQYDRVHASVIFASILRDIFNHTDWSELHPFFTKRYRDTSEQPEADVEPAEGPRPSRPETGGCALQDGSGLGRPAVGPD